MKRHRERTKVAAMACLLLYLGRSARAARLSRPSGALEDAPFLGSAGASALRSSLVNDVDSYEEHRRIVKHRDFEAAGSCLSEGKYDCALRFFGVMVSEAVEVAGSLPSMKEGDVLLLGTAFYNYGAACLRSYPDIYSGAYDQFALIAAARRSFWTCIHLLPPLLQPMSGDGDDRAGAEQGSPGDESVGEKMRQLYANCATGLVLLTSATSRAPHPFVEKAGQDWCHPLPAHFLPQESIEVPLQLALLFERYRQTEDARTVLGVLGDRESSDEESEALNGVQELVERHSSALLTLVSDDVYDAAIALVDPLDSKGHAPEGKNGNVQQRESTPINSRSSRSQQYLREKCDSVEGEARPTIGVKEEREVGEVGDKAPEIGIFLLMGVERLNLVQTHPVLCRALLLLYRSPQYRPVVERVRLHVLSTWEGDEHKFLEGLAEVGHALWGGLHLVAGQEVPSQPMDGNYLRKIFTAFDVSLKRGYSHIMSVDDDIIISPEALAFMIEQQASVSYERPKRHPKNGDGAGRSEGWEGGGGAHPLRCAYLAPALSTGIPTVDMFIESFLSEDEAVGVRDCFARTVLPEDVLAALRLGQQPDEAQAEFEFDLPNEANVEIGVGDFPWRDFDSKAFYGRVKRALPHILEPGNVRAFAGGIHPVRFNRECSTLMGDAARRLMETELLRRGGTGGKWADFETKEEQQQHKETERHRNVTRKERTEQEHRLYAAAWDEFPYFCNSMWMASVEFVFEVLSRADWYTWSHPYDEAPMTMLVKEEQLTTCYVQNSFAVHPSYFHDDQGWVDHLELYREADTVLKAATEASEGGAEEEDLGEEIFTVPLSRDTSLAQAQAESLGAEVGDKGKASPPRRVVKRAACCSPSSEGEEQKVCEHVPRTAAAAAAAVSAAEVAVFLHLRALAGWEGILSELLSRITASGLPETVKNLQVFLVVTAEGSTECQEVISHQNAFRSSAESLDIEVECFPHMLLLQELPVLMRVWHFARGHGNHSILYLNANKGRGGPEHLGSAQWRDYLSYFTLDHHRLCLERLLPGDGEEQGSQTVTCGVDLMAGPQDSWFYSGNVWWARADYLAQLGTPQKRLDLFDYPPPGNMAWERTLEHWIGGPAVSVAAAGGEGGKASASIGAHTHFEMWSLGDEQLERHSQGSDYRHASVECLSRCYATAFSAG